MFTKNKSYNKKKIAIKTLLYLLSLATIAFGVMLVISANIGGDSVTVLYTGIKHTFKVSYGTATYMYQISIIAIACIFARKYVGIGTVLFSLTFGMFMYVWEFIFKYIPIHPVGIYMQMLTFIGGQMFISMGLAGLIELKVGTNGLDCIILTICDKKDIKYGYIKTMADIIIMSTGYMLGGLVGFASLFSMLSLGFNVQLFLYIINKIKHISVF